ncbi:hypothetical protein I547_3232 [Mycobacterium kansasii 824]|uniref:Uncharacterized protein n=1 Tax=Mycobacterium kansasii TaxID=1768 RepID=A0A1V3XH21_MYCKA|nr:hypothetical protein I547_3232 [Mycobacterium kansasii 824]OOK78505.1 hypothetical protein BZL30_2994 [Mycobacterium kansasii]OOK80025.1 hypothetical protein BZL29_2918 [Mycobacterium kansasii]
MARRRAAPAGVIVAATPGQEQSARSQDTQRGAKSVEFQFSS